MWLQVSCNTLGRHMQHHTFLAWAGRLAKDWKLAQEDSESTQRHGQTHQETRVSHL